MEPQEPARLARSRIPWLVLAAALAVFALTANRWLSLASLPLAASLAGFDPLPPLTAPITWLVTWPVRLLPPGAQPLVLNGLSVVFAALTLALLARSVAILPHDRTREQRQKQNNEAGLFNLRTAWLPPVFAAGLCGFQLSFWEHATTGTGEMLDLLLFAYIVRCLLEYRLDPGPSWLYRLSFVYGLGMANNYALIAFIPLCLTAVIWIMGRDLLEFRFFSRMLGFGALGLSFYFILPLVTALDASAGTGFWDALRFELLAQKATLRALASLRLILFLTGLIALLPLLMMGIRWPASFGDTSIAGSMLTHFIFRFMHAVFLVAIVWVAFDAQFGARILVARKMELAGVDGPAVPFLTLYYLAALSAGYFLGYYLLVCSPESAETQSWQRESDPVRSLNKVLLAVTVAVGIAAPAALAARNFQTVRLNDGSVLRGFAALATRTLPATGGVAISDHSFLLNAARYLSWQNGSADRTLWVDSKLARVGWYQARLHATAPTKWPPPPKDMNPRDGVLPGYLAAQLVAVTQSNTVHYLNPSFGFFFENLYAVPNGIAQRLVTYATNEIVPPPLPAAVVDANQRFWADAAPTLDRVRALGSRFSADARAVSRWYSADLNAWGVQLQRLARLDDAASTFRLALSMDPGNVSADLNLAFNEILRTGRSSRPRVETFAERFGTHRGWNSLLASGGPVDDPEVRLQLGQTLVQQGLSRQGVLEFIRATELDRTNLSPRLLLAETYVLVNLPAKALDVTRAVRAQGRTTPLGTNLIPIAIVEASAQMALGKPAEAEKLLFEARQSFPKDTSLLEMLTQIYFTDNRLTDAMLTVDQALKLNPDNPVALLHKGAIHIQLGSYNKAVEPLTRALDRDPQNLRARLNRAIANLKSGRLDEARSDYQMLERSQPGLFQAQYGLGQVADLKKEKDEAIKHYEAYLAQAPPGSDEYSTISNRVHQLKTGGR